MTTDFPQKLHHIFAEAYHAAARQEADMQGLAATLEAIRKQLKNTGDSLAARAALDAAVGGNRDDRALPALLALRKDFIVWQKEVWLADIETAFKKSPEEAWRFFLHRYVESLSFWRTQLALWWTETVLGESPENSKVWFPNKNADLRRIQINTRFMEQRRWPEAYPFLRQLASNALLPDKMQAHLWTVCGSVQMYFNTITDAQTDLAEAEKRFPELPYWVVCRADLERISGNYQDSREILKQHLSTHPKDAEALMAMGRSFSEEKNWAEAERWFDAAIAADPGNASAYRDKFALWGKNEELFKEKGEEIPEMVEQANRTDPESELVTFLEAGYTYQNAGNLEAARQWFQKALDMEPDRLESLVSIGYLDQTEQKHDKAETCYQKALQLAPGATDGYWNMAGLCNEQGKFVEAAAWFEKALPNCPLFTRTLLVKAAEMYIAAGEFEKAKASCLESLKIDPVFDYALNTLHDLSDKLRDKAYEEKTGMEPALATLSAIRAIKGDAYEASFQNRTGNVYYYFNDYPNAAECYRKAIAADSSQAVYHDNLAGTLEKLAEKDISIALFEESYKAAQLASQLEPLNEGYHKQTARIGYKYKSLRHFGTLPEERNADISPVRVRFQEELYPHLVKDGELVPTLLQGIETLREKFKKAYGITIPGVRFSTDWNIGQGANYVIDLDGIPMQQGWLNFASDTAEPPIETLLSAIGQHFEYGLADFIHYDSPEISAKFVGKPAAYAAGFFQIVRMLLKQKIAISEINIVHELYELGVQSGKSIQVIMEGIRRHPAIKPALPVNTAAVRTLQYLNPEQEQGILASTGRSASGQMFWQIRPEDPVFYQILSLLPQVEYTHDGPAQFVVTQNATVATLLNDLHPVTFFGREELLNLTEMEQAQMPSAP